MTTLFCSGHCGRIAPAYWASVGESFHHSPGFCSGVTVTGDERAVLDLAADLADSGEYDDVAWPDLVDAARNISADQWETDIIEDADALARDVELVLKAVTP